jgi:acyl-coenzyme A synthetase/AMP-(fatty) acid ligase
MDPLYRGRTAIVREGTIDASVWPRLIRKHAATIFIAVPTIYRQILQKTAVAKADLPSLRHCMCAGEPLSDEVLVAWRDRFGLEIYEALGMSEFSYYLCETKTRAIRPGSVGFVQPGHDVRLLDSTTLHEVPVDTEGMLCVRTGDPNLMLRYWNRPEETESAFRGDWFLTGDYARRDEDGYIWFLGRKDDLINSFGYRVSPHEIERVLKDHPNVADAAVVGEEAESGKTLVAAYVIRRCGSDLTAQDIIAYGGKHLASYKAPRIVHFVEALPRTPAGKVLRRALRDERP